MGDAGSWLRFNLAHSGDIALVAIGVGLEVGVDVEAVRDDAAARRDLLAISERVLGPDVTKDLEQAPIDQRVRRFSRAWVRHEARAKCHGEGLVDASVAAAAPADDAVAVFDLDVGAGYAAALAVGGTPRAVRQWEVA